MIVCSWIARFPLSVETSFILWILHINLSRLKRLVHVNGSITVWRNTFSNTSQPFKWNWDGSRAASWSLLACLRQFLHNPLRSSKPCVKSKIRNENCYWFYWLSIFTVLIVLNLIEIILTVFSVLRKIEWM